MNFRRLSMTLGVTSLLISGIYACSSDDDTNGTASGNDAGVDTGTVKADTGTTGTPDTGTTETPDTGTTEEDAGDAGTVTTADCVGNPLVADGGSPDASFNIATSAFAAGTGAFLYGPAWTDELGGNIIYSEAYFQQLSYSNGDGGAPTKLAATDTSDDIPLQNTVSNGFVYTALSAQDDGGTLMKTQIDGGSAVVPTFFRLPAVDGGTVYPSGIAVHSKGAVFFTDPQFNNSGIPFAGIYSMPSFGGSPISTVATYDSSTSMRPVGIAFNKDQSALYVSVFFDAATAVPGGQILKYAVDANGVVGAKTILPFLPAGRPLGIAVDSVGNVWIAEQAFASTDTAQVGLVEVISADGTEKWGTIHIPDANATGVAFGGPDRKKVYITTERGGTAGTLYQTASRCAGF